MASRAASYPHPVVGNRDDVEGSIIVEAPNVSIESDWTTITFPSLDSSNATLRELLDRGQAEYVVRVECGMTLYRDAWAGRRAPFEFRIPSGSLSGTVELALEICTTSEFKGYRPAGLNPDYGDARFDLEAGAVIGLGDLYHFEVENEFDPLAGSVSSIMRVRPIPEPDQLIQVHYDTDLITIDLSREDQRAYGLLQNTSPGVIHSALAFPALIEAIRLVREPPVDSAYETRPWFKRLRSMLDKAAIPESEAAFSAAGRLLNSPLRRAAQNMQRLIEQGDQ